MRCPGEFPGKISSITSYTIHSNNTQGSISQLIAPETRYPLKVLIKHSRLPPPHILITTLIHNITKNFNKMWNLLCIINQWWWNNGRRWGTLYTNVKFLKYEFSLVTKNLIEYIPQRNFQSYKVPGTVVTWDVGIIFRVAGKIFSKWKIALLEQESVIIIPGARKETVLCNYWKLITFSQTGFQNLL